MYADVNDTGMKSSEAASQPTHLQAPTVVSLTSDDACSRKLDDGTADTSSKSSADTRAISSDSPESSCSSQPQDDEPVQLDLTDVECLRQIYTYHTQPSVYSMTQNIYKVPEFVNIMNQCKKPKTRRERIEETIDIRPPQVQKKKCISLRQKKGLKGSSQVSISELFLPYKPVEAKKKPARMAWKPLSNMKKVVSREERVEVYPSTQFYFLSDSECPPPFD